VEPFKDLVGALNGILRWEGVVGTVAEYMKTMHSNKKVYLPQSKIPL